MRLPKLYDPDFYRTCTGCGEVGDTVEERYSFGYYAGRLCKSCCRTFRDHCGEDQPQGKVEDLDEFMAGGYPAIEGD